MSPRVDPCKQHAEVQAEGAMWGLVVEMQRELATRWAGEATRAAPREEAARSPGEEGPGWSWAEESLLDRVWGRSRGEKPPRLTLDRRLPTELQNCALQWGGRRGGAPWRVMAGALG